LGAIDIPKVLALMVMKWTLKTEFLYSCHPFRAREPLAHPIIGLDFPQMEFWFDYGDSKKAEKLTLDY
jgi:hypothetical protein